MPVPSEQSPVIKRDFTSKAESREEIVVGAIQILHDCLLRGDYSIPQWYSRAKPELNEEQGRQWLMCRTNNVRMVISNMEFVRDLYFQNDPNAQNIVDQQIEVLNNIVKSDIPPKMQEAMASINSENYTNILQMLESKRGEKAKTTGKFRKKKEMLFVRGCIRTVCYLCDQSRRLGNKNKGHQIEHRKPKDLVEQQSSLHLITLSFSAGEFENLEKDCKLSIEGKKPLSGEAQKAYLIHYCKKFLKDVVRNKLDVIELFEQEKPVSMGRNHNKSKKIKMAVGWNVMQKILFEALENNTTPDELASYAVKVGLTTIDNKQAAEAKAEKLIQVGSL